MSIVQIVHLSVQNFLWEKRRMHRTKMYKAMDRNLARHLQILLAFSLEYLCFYDSSYYYSWERYQIFFFMGFYRIMKKPSLPNAQK